MTRPLYRSLGALLISSTLSIGASLAHAQEATEEEKTEELAKDKSWTDDFSIGMFVDAYGAVRSDNNSARNLSPNAVSEDVGAYAGTPAHEAYVQGSGFGLAFAGADLAYSGKEFGATVSLRFGPGVNRFFYADNGPLGIDNVTQAFVTWKPRMVEGLTLDLGQFYTIYGAEVAESWRNMNYSRGALYYAMQPFWHTGLRANYKINDMIALNALVVNGVNTAFEGNKSPSLGIQALFTPTPELFFALGYLTPLNPRNGDEEVLATLNFQDFIDFVGTATYGDFKIVANADLNSYRAKGSSDREYWWGVSLAPGYSFTNWFGVAARVEHLQDSANSQLIQATTGKAKLTTLTGTLDFKPVPNSAALVIRPEFRYELAGDDTYLSRKDTATDKFWSAHLGVVVTSMP
jgi:Putative beta-barrel porin-2, OmpL-like. bbp2